MTDLTLKALLDRRTRFLAFVEGRVRDRALAEDILQAAYMRALEKAPAMEEESAAAWFYSVLRHAVIDHYRRSSTEGAGRERWAREMGFDEGEPAAPEGEARGLVCGCIEHVLPMLRPAYAEVLREVDMEEMPLAEYAKKHSLTAGNAAVRAHRARAALRKELARVCGVCSLHACLDCGCKRPEA